MKEWRLEGRVRHSQYIIEGPHGVVKEIPLEQAREDTKLASAIRRNGWEAIPDGE